MTIAQKSTPCAADWPFEVSSLSMGLEGAEEMREDEDTADVYGDKTQAVKFLALESVEPGERMATLIVIGGRAFGKSFNLDGDDMVIGRAPSCEIFLDDDGISRQHARVVRAEGQYVILDLDSTNGTYHDGERIQALTLCDGDKVQVGLNTILRFQFQDVMDERYQRSIYESKTRDPLTGAYNRAYFMEAIDREVAFAQRHKNTLSLILFDVDHFKRVNDSYGHSAGDTALKMIVRAVQDTIRREDILARYGGEEFAVLLRDTSSEMAFILAERIRRAVEKMEIVHEGQRVPCTVSLGISHTSERLAESRALIDAADERLYRAKDGGRNRTETPVLD